MHWVRAIMVAAGRHHHGGRFRSACFAWRTQSRHSAGTQLLFWPAALSLRGITSADLLPRRGQSSRPRHRCPPPPRPQVRPVLMTGRAQRRVLPLRQLAAAAGTWRHWRRGTLQGEAASRGVCKLLGTGSFWCAARWADGLAFVAVCAVRGAGNCRRQAW